MSSERRTQASAALFAHLSPMLAPFGYVLSFASFAEEIDLSAVNAQLATHERLLLPKINGDDLAIYIVTALDQQLGCETIDLKKIDCILVPGLGFDHAKNRLGRGKGYYDRFLQKLSDKDLNPLRIGIGFKEQLSQDLLPVEAHDFPVDELLLF